METLCSPSLATNYIIKKSLKLFTSVVQKNNIDKITIDDLIQEVAYQNSKRNKYNDKQRRKLVLDNYFKGNSNITKFPSKHKMEKALKNINYEMEKASQEFSLLFNYDDKYK